MVSGLLKEAKSAGGGVVGPDGGEFATGAGVFCFREFHGLAVFVEAVGGGDVGGDDIRVSIEILGDFTGGFGSRWRWGCG